MEPGDDILARINRLMAFRKHAHRRTTKDVVKQHGMAKEKVVKHRLGMNRGQATLVQRAGSLEVFDPETFGR